MEDNIEAEIRKQLDIELMAHDVRLNSESEQFIAIYKNIEGEICGTLAQGLEAFLRTVTFPSLRNQLDNIEQSNKEKKVKRIGSIVDWGFSEIIEQNLMQHIILADIVGLLNIPDIEKERKSNIEKGLAFFKKGLQDNQFYKDSKIFFEKALQAEEVDYYVLYNLGLIHLFTPDFLSIDKATNYFEKAAKYAQSDVNFSSGELNDNKSTFSNTINPKNITKNALLYQARCAYGKGETTNAIQYVINALKLAPNDTEILFDKARYQFYAGEISDALMTFKKILEIDHFMILKILKNMDLIKSEKVRQFLLDQKNEVSLNTQQEYHKCAGLISKTSIFEKELKNTFNLIRIGTFLSFKKAQFILN